MVKNCVSSHKTNYIDILSEILSFEGHQSHCIGSKETAILLNGWILPSVVELHQEGSAPAACAAGLFWSFFHHLQDYLVATNVDSLPCCWFSLMRLSNSWILLWNYFKDFKILNNPTLHKFKIFGVGSRFCVEISFKAIICFTVLICLNY